MDNVNFKKQQDWNQIKNDHHHHSWKTVDVPEKTPQVRSCAERYSWFPIRDINYATGLDVAQPFFNVGHLINS